MDVVMPKMGESVTEGTIIKWYKKVGDSINVDETIFEISTDKVDTEVPSPVAGVLVNIKVEEGDTVEVGTVVGVIDEAGKSTTIEEHRAEIKEVKKVEPEPIKTGHEIKEVKSSTSSEVINVTMPKMGESVMEGTILKWFKTVGDKVEKDETMFEISTDKVDTEVPSPVAGTVVEILVAEQETVDVDTIVAKLSTGESTTTSPSSEKIIQQVKEETKILENDSMHAAISNNVNNEEKLTNTSGSRFYSPLVLSIAAKEGISIDELNNINGTGLSGRVTKKDIKQYVETRKSSAKTIVKESVSHRVDSVKPSINAAPITTGTDINRIPMDNIRQKIMQYMVNSRDTSVHVSSMMEIDLTKIYNYIKNNKENIYNNQGIKITYMAFIADACVKALKAFPLVNSSIEDSVILQKKYINLGIAVALEPNGLIVPNIKGAEQRNILGLAKSINELAYNSRNKKLTPDDITNGTFTITNFGVFGVTMGTPIINQPEVAILGVGAVVKKPVVIEVDGADTISIRPTMTLTLSHDHRLVDGKLGGQFLKYIKDTLESFESSNV